MGSKYTEQILNTIAKGNLTSSDICASIQSNYPSTQRILRTLTKEKRIYSHRQTRFTSKSGEKYAYSLAFMERWRLNSFDYRYLFIDNNAHYIFPTDSIDCAFHISGFDIYNVNIQDIDLPISYIQTELSLEKVFESIDKNIEFRNFLPLLLITNTQEIHATLIKNIGFFYHYNLPILLHSPDGISWLNEPAKTKVKKFIDDTINRILTEMERRYPLVLKLKKKIEHMESIHAKKEDLDKAYEYYRKHALTTVRISQALSLETQYTSKQCRVLQHMGKIEKEEGKWQVGINRTWKLCN